MVILLLLCAVMDTSEVINKLKKADSLYYNSYKDSTLLEKADSIYTSLLEDSVMLDEIFWRKSYVAFQRADGSEKKEEKMRLFKKGEKLARKALEINPENAEAHYWLAANMGSIGKLRGVMSSLSMVDDLKSEAERALEIDPDHSGAHIILGEIYRSLPGLLGGNKEKAIEHFRTSIENDTLYTAAYIRLAETFFDLKKYNEAEKILQKMLSLEDWRDPRRFHLHEKEEAEMLLEKIQENK